MDHLFGSGHKRLSPKLSVAELGGPRTFLAVPMLKENELVGTSTSKGCTKRQWARDHLARDRRSRHTGRVPETPTQSDLEKAHLILSEFGLLIGPAGEMSDVIARAVAAGIALGRKEALAEKRRKRE